MFAAIFCLFYYDSLVIVWRSRKIGLSDVSTNNISMTMSATHSTLESAASNISRTPLSSLQAKECQCQ